MQLIYETHKIDDCLFTMEENKQCYINDERRNPDLGRPTWAGVDTGDASGKGLHGTTSHVRNQGEKNCQVSEKETPEGGGWERIINAGS